MAEARGRGEFLVDQLTLPQQVIRPIAIPENDPPIYLLNPHLLFLKMLVLETKA